MICEVPLGRWDVMQLINHQEWTFLRGGASAMVASFASPSCDNRWFGVSPAEAAAMDPQQRMLLERGYDALHGAGLNKSTLIGSLTGVFIGAGVHDFEEVVKSSPTLRSNVYSATGSSASVMSGRLSYVLGMQGACAAYDTACSAALMANHAALHALQFDECDDALMAGVNLVLLPGVSISFAVAGMTAPHGACHTFDSRADGYARGEAVSAASLKTAHDDVANRLPSMLGSAVRCDGKSASLTAPNGQAQQALLRASLLDAAVSADAVSCTEAHGTGTALGDPIEARSLAGAVLRKRQGGRALALGSFKANVGHGEPGRAPLACSISRWGYREHRRHRMRSCARSTRTWVRRFRGARVCCLGVETGLSPSQGIVGGVSSFGYSGTIVHAVLCSRGTGAASSLALLLPPPFLWRIARTDSPLMRRRDGANTQLPGSSQPLQRSS